MKKIALCSQNFASIGGIENSLINIKNVLGEKNEVKVYSFNSPVPRDDIEVTTVSKSRLYSINRLLFTGTIASYFAIKKFSKSDSFLQSCDIIVCRSVQFAAAIAKSFPHKNVIYIPPAIMEEFYTGVISDLSLKNSPIKLIKYKLISKLECYLEKLSITSNNVKCLTFSCRLAEKLKLKYPYSDVTNKFPGVNAVFNSAKPKASKNNIKIPTFLYVGRLEPGKNIEFLVNIFTHLQDVARLVMVGDGTLIDSLKNKNLPNVEFRGSKSGQSLADEYINADMLILPTKNEGFGQVLIESLCCGTPILGYGSNVANTAISEIISQPQFGLEICEIYDGDMKDSILMACSKISAGYFDKVNIMKSARVAFSWRSFCENIVA